MNYRALMTDLARIEFAPSPDAHARQIVAAPDVARDEDDYAERFDARLAVMLDAEGDRDIALAMSRYYEKQAAYHARIYEVAVMDQNSSTEQVERALRIAALASTRHREYQAAHERLSGGITQ